MALTKQQKQKIVGDLKEMLSRQKAIILAGISGLKVKDITELRKKLKAIDGNLKVAKKTLIELAFKESHLKFDKDKFTEGIALAFGFKGDELRSSSPSLHSLCSFRSGDEVLLSKTVYQFSRENEKLKILGGYLEGNFKESEEIVALAQIPSKEELLARLVGSISSPISGLVYVLQGNIRNLVYIISQIKPST